MRWRIALALLLSAAVTSAKTYTIPGNRAASVYVAASFINQQLAEHVKSEIVRGLSLAVDPERNHIFLRGTIHVPVEEMRAINLDPKLGKYRFQVAIKLETTKQGHLIVEFPVTQTYFYPVDSRDENDRVVVPVQLLSLALASVRGYLAALSGDFSGFDRRERKLIALVKSLDHAISHEKNPDARDDLKTQRESLRLQLASIPIERKQLQSVSKEVGTMLGFTGEKELSLNDTLGAYKNALILKIRLSQLAPFLKGVDLGGVRILHDTKDGGGEDYLVIDVNAESAGERLPDRVVQVAQREGAKIAPSLMLRLNQSLFESEALRRAERERMGGKIRDFNLQLKDDGLHVSGRYRPFLFSVGFDTVVDFVSTGPDVFEARVRDVAVAGIDLKFLTGYVLASVRKRLDQSLKGTCSFRYVDRRDDNAEALEVTVNPKALVPAFPFLHLIQVDVRDQEFILKLGKV